MGTQVFNETLSVTSAYTFTSSYSAPTAENMFNSPYVPARVDVFVANNDDTVDHTLTVFWSVGAFTYKLGAVVVSAGRGVTTGAPLDLLAALLPATFQQIQVAQNVTIAVALEAAPSVGKTVNVLLQGGFLS